jgi:hypothetical protein
MAISETGSIQAEKLAIEQINASGGVLGRKIEYVQEDGASDWPTFAEKARKLLVSDKVAAIFGGWTSASRKAMLPVLEQYNGMLYYPTFYEGLEQSPNVITHRPEATQQIISGIDWVVKTSMPNRSIFSVLTISGHVPPTKLPVIILKVGSEGGRGRLLSAGQHAVQLGDQQNQAEKTRCDLRHCGWRL